MSEFVYTVMHRQFDAGTDSYGPAVWSTLEGARSDVLRLVADHLDDLECDVSDNGDDVLVAFYDCEVRLEAAEVDWTGASPPEVVFP